ncbi:MAG TPA: GNAT family acetyltransferase [Sphingobium sp.]|nr:GNAT family acetyltransferase [Sphingobium sp.]
MNAAPALAISGGPAAPAEREAVIALWSRCGLTRPWNDPVADFDAALAGPASAVLVLRAGGRVLATAMVGHDGHRGSVYYLAVDPASQRQGLGRRLMADVEAWLRARGVPKLNLLVRTANAAVIGFYAALGYGDNDCLSLGKRLDG